MLRFFRQIRQRLLTDNKFSKYLLYAVGEILLVVIGILIALQVDNLNEERKNRELEMVFLERLKSDLVTDTIYLNRRINRADTIIKRGQTYLPEMYKNQENFQEYFALTNTNIWDSEDMVIQKATYNELNNTGGFNLISNRRLKEQILSHYFKYEAIDSHIKELNVFSISLLREIIDLHFKKYNVVDAQEQTNVRVEMDWKYINDPLSKEFMDLETAVDFYKGKHEIFMGYFEESLVRSRHLIDEISLELKNDD